jgi:hypothetical protein
LSKSKSGKPNGTSISAPSNSKTYQLSVNQTQARVLQEALDLYSRILMGQLSEVSHKIHGPYDHQEANKYLEIAKTIIFPNLERGASYGVGGACEESKISYEMMAVIRRFLAFERNPEGDFLVDFDTPLKVSKEPLPDFKRV